MTKTEANPPAGIVNEKFPYKICINLDRRPERWRDMQRKFDQHGIQSVRRFPAVDGDNIKLPANWTHTPGARGCLLSHLEVVREALRIGLPSILIFEDDAVPDPERIKQLPKILSEVPSDCELLMWGWSKNGESDINTIFKKAVYNIQYKLGILKWDHQVIQNLFARPFSSQLKKAGFHDYTYAYAITRSAAEKLLQMQSPIQYIADNLLAYAVTNNLVNGYIVYPPAFLHDSLPDGTARDSYIR